MIFGAEMIEKILAGEKTETRRWHDPYKPCRYKVGRDYAVQPGRGKPQVARIRVLEVGIENLDAVGADAARREGFGGRQDFEDYWRKVHGWWNAGVWVWVIRFELVGPSKKRGGASVLGLGAGGL